MLFFLIGYMGSGKTSLAKRVSKLTGIPYIDSDKAIAQGTGKTIPEIFEQDGEAHFRSLEHQFMAELEPNQDLIISTGGGLPCFNDNISLINSKGTSFYLQLSPEKLFQRLTQSNTERPLIKKLSGDDLLAYLKSHLAEREKFYLKAHHLIDANRPFAHISEQLAEEIKRKI